jgi:hypothetical protein
LVNRGRITGKPVEELAANPLPDNAIRAEKSDNHTENDGTITSLA